MLTVEQVMSSHKANIETLLGLTTKAFEGVEKIVELNLTASKAALAESGETAKAMLSVKDAQELLALQSGLFQPLAEKTAAYSRHLYDIASGAATDVRATISTWGQGAAPFTDGTALMPALRAARLARCHPRLHASAATQRSAH